MESQTHPRRAVGERPSGERTDALGDPANYHLNMRAELLRRTARARNPTAGPSPPHELDFAARAGEHVATAAEASAHWQEVVDAWQAHLAHLVLEGSAMAAGKPALMQPRVHHFVKQRSFELPRMRGKQRCGKFDDWRTMADATRYRREPTVVDDAVGAQHAAKVARVQVRIE